MATSQELLTGFDREALDKPDDLLHHQAEGRRALLRADHHVQSEDPEDLVLALEDAAEHIRAALETARSWHPPGWVDGLEPDATVQ